MKNNLFIIITSFVVLVLLAICVITISVKPTYSKLTFDEFKNIESGLVYFGDLDSDVKKLLKKYDQSFTIKEYIVLDYNVEDLNTFLKENKLNTIEEKGYVFVNNGVPVWSGDKTFNEKELNEEINYQLNGTLRSSDIVYKIPSKAEDMVNIINSKKYTVTVMSKSDCSYCTLYQPVINNIAKNYNLDIYYLDRDKYSESDYKKFKNLDLEVKEDCTTGGLATTTKSEVQYPLLLITKNGKSVDCILGYRSENEVLELLSKYNIIK